MSTAKLFQNGKSQAVRLPKEYRFDGCEVKIKKIGDLVLLFSPDKEWDIFMHGIDSFTDDYAIEHINDLHESIVEF
ncbi:MAG: type II toxin-antitoxin system VapB family antitoxin [Dehalococcoidia bacterium]|nr:type II toxin-antitoxin system VapB family antitoxin [Dehalococcoidia bacterium]